MGDIARQIRFFFPEQRKDLIATLFADRNLRRICDPVHWGPEIASKTRVAGVFIDTFVKRDATLYSI